ncbi:MAG: hypothetical protein FJZ63_06095 [Chlamydiae bacterium]|nr:hypothetical protein [Chlamydiota bacterium]
MKAFNILATLTFTTLALAASDLDKRVRELEKKLEAISATTAEDTFGAVTALARPETLGKHFFLSLDVLYWQSKVGGTAYAQSTQLVVNMPVTEVGSIREPSFDWDFGIKAGIGYNFSHDGWDGFAEFTYLHNKASDSTSVNRPAGLYPLDAPLALTASSEQDILRHNVVDFALEAESSLSVKFYDLNVELGRDFFVSEYLGIRPSFGLKSTWMALDQHSSFTGGGTAYTLTDTANASIAIEGLQLSILRSDRNNKMYGLGPRAALNSRWFFGEGFSFYGNASAGLLFSYFKNSYYSTYSTYPSNISNVKYRFHALVPTADFGLGLAYDNYVMEKTQHIHISLGYENKVFWDAGYLASATTSPFNVGFYGVDLKIRWDF